MPTTDGLEAHPGIEVTTMNPDPYANNPFVQPSSFNGSVKPRQVSSDTSDVLQKMSAGRNGTARISSQKGTITDRLATSIPTTRFTSALRRKFARQPKPTDRVRNTKNRGHHKNELNGYRSKSLPIQKIFEGSDGLAELLGADQEELEKRQQMLQETSTALYRQ